MMRTALMLAAGAGCLLLTAAPAQACSAGAPVALIEFAEGSAEVDAVDRKELEDFVAAARRETGYRLSLRAFADEAGSFDSASWSDRNMALASARAEAVIREMILLGSPPVLDRHVAGVAPAGSPGERTGVNGAVRRARVSVAVERYADPRPAAESGSPVPVC